MAFNQINNKKTFLFFFFFFFLVTIVVFHLICMFLFIYFKVKLIRYNAGFFRGTTMLIRDEGLRGIYQGLVITLLFSPSQ